jgi:hypothetical protein
MKEFLKIFGPVAIGISIIWLAWWQYAERFSTKMDERGQLGDLFGGVNAIFSGLALAGVVTAVVLQSKELQLQREEMKAQREQLELQREELTLSREEFKRMAEANEQAATALTRQSHLQIQAAKIHGLSALVSVSNARALSDKKYHTTAQQRDAETETKEHAKALRSAIDALED